VAAKIHLDHEVPAVFRMIARGGPVEETEMRRTFNLGVGLVAIVDKGSSDRALATLAAADERAWVMGSIVPTEAGAPPRVDIVS
jgi:phosphoribosylformylglycinamidine cyclo-ligase